MRSTRPSVAALLLLTIVTASPASQLPITFLSDIAFDQPRVTVYLRSSQGYLPIGTEGYVVPGLLDTGAAAHVLPAYLAGVDGLNVPIDPAGEAEILTLCGYTEFLDITQPLYVGVGPVEDPENEAAYVESATPHRLAVRRIDPPLSDLLMFPMIVGTPFLHDYAVRTWWEIIEVFPGIELPQLVTRVHPAGQPSGQPIDVTVPLTLAGETNPDPVPSLPTAYSVPFVDVVVTKGPMRQRRSFILDTGAQITFLSSELAEAVGVDLSSPDGPGLPVAGAGSCDDITLYPYLLDRLVLPTDQGVALVFEQPVLYVLDVPGIDGGIGSNLLYYFEELDAAEVDIVTRRVSLDLNVPAPPAGDLDGDGEVSVLDVTIVVTAFSREVGDPDYVEEADLDWDGTVDVTDIIRVIATFGQTIEP